MADWAAHLRRAQMEDVEFLLAQGVQLEEACKRVGVKVEAVDQRVRRDARVRERGYA